MPGAIMGVLGILFVLVSFFYYASQSSSVLATSIFVLFGILSLVTVVRLTLKYLMNSKDEKGFALHTDQEGYMASVFDKEQIGKEGVVLTDLKPGGRIVIEGKTHQAISVGGYIPAGDKILVIRGEGINLIVKRI